MEIIFTQLTLPKEVSSVLVLILNKFILQMSVIGHNPKDYIKFILKNSALFPSLLSFSL